MSFRPGSGKTEGFELVEFNVDLFNENVAVVLDGEAILRRPKPAWLARAFGDP